MMGRSGEASLGQGAFRLRLETLGEGRGEQYFGEKSPKRIGKVSPY